MAKRTKKYAKKGAKHVKKAKKVPVKTKQQKKYKAKASLAGGKIPFTLAFNSKSHHKHKEGDPTMEGVTVVLTKHQYRWLRKVSTLLLEHRAIKKGRMDTEVYKYNLHCFMSHLYMEKAYEKYRAEVNSEALKCCSSGKKSTGEVAVSKELQQDMHFGEHMVEDMIEM